MSPEEYRNADSSHVPPVSGTHSFCPVVCLRSTSYLFFFQELASNNVSVFWASLGLTPYTCSHVNSGHYSLSPCYLACVVRQRIHVHASVLLNWNDHLSERDCRRMRRTRRTLRSTNHCPTIFGALSAHHSLRCRYEETWRRELSTLRWDSSGALWKCTAYGSGGNGKMEGPSGFRGILRSRDLPCGIVILQLTSLLHTL